MDDLYAGCMCGFVQTAVGHPLDTAKVLLQTSSLKTTQARSMIGLKRTQLNPRVLYRGVTYPFLFNGFFSGVTFACNDYLSRQKYFHNNYQSGYVTGILGAVLTTPVDLYKVRAQSAAAAAPLSKSELGKQQSAERKFPFGGRTGTQGFMFRGFIPTFHRESIGSAIYFGSYGALQENRGHNPLLHGGLSGVLSWLCTYPIDTVKTRIQSGGAKTMRQAFRGGQLWRGVVPCLVRSFIVNACGFYAYEWFK